MTCKCLVTWRNEDGTTDSMWVFDPAVYKGYLCGTWGGVRCRVCKESIVVSVRP